MLKVLVVDDERLVRQMIMRCIDWSGLGLEIVGEASGAEEGMEMVTELRPDVVFTDIRMPVVDGLEFGRRVLERYPKTKIVILSGHDEFEYASEGLKMGVFDYLLKPINRDEITEAAIKVRDAVLEERNQDREVERLRSKLKENAKYIMENQFTRLIQTQEPRAALENLEYLGMKLQGDTFQVALADVEALCTENTPACEEEKLLLEIQSRELIEEFFTGMPAIHVFGSGMQSTVIFNNDEEAAFPELCEHLKEYLLERMKGNICIGIGEAYHTLEGLKISYQEAREALKYRFVAGTNQTTRFRDICQQYGVSISMSEENIHEFGFLIRTGRMQEILELLESLYQEMREANYTKERTILFALRFVMEMMTVLVELKISLENMPKSQNEIIEEIFRLGSLDETRAYLREIIISISKVIMQELGDKEKNLVSNVKDYLEDHFQEEDISLASVSELFFVNSSYLSRTFKEKTGKTFSGYLFELRLEKSILLFQQSDLKAYEVAERVGIKDPHYFSACFKKYTGMSVSEFKKGKG